LLWYISIGYDSISGGLLFKYIREYS